MISVIIPTYNPDLKILHQVLSALAEQTLELDFWEIIVIDNNSTSGFESLMDLSWHPRARVVTEVASGLTYARLKGISMASSAIIVMVDDDNILKRNYLQQVLQIFNSNPSLGAIGGKITPMFEGSNNQLALAFENLLAVRDFGEDIQICINSESYPSIAPVGAGMAFRKSSICTYVSKIVAGKNLISDRKGNSLSSSGDNEMVWEIINSGWAIGYFPELQLQHIIPEVRTKKEYLAKLNFQIQESWVLFLLKHNICPWKTILPFSLPFRKLKSWIKFRAWKNEVNYIKWRGICGTFNGLANFKKIETT